MNAFSLKLGVTLVAVLGVLGINAALAGPIKVTVGTSHSLVVKSDGSAWGWGDNFYGQLGNAYLYGTSTPVAPPIKANVSRVVAMAAPCYTTVVLRSNGTVWTYGENAGQLGNNTTLPPTTYTPTQVLVKSTGKALANIIAISAFSDRTLALKSDGTVWAWGKGRDGQLGDGTTINHFAAVQVLTARATSTTPAVALSGVVSIFTGNYTSYAIKADGTVWVWGSNRNYGLGDTNTTLTNLLAAKFPGLTNVSAIAPGLQHYVALKKDGTVWTWGRNSMTEIDPATGQYVTVLGGQLGDNSPKDATRATPTMLTSLSGITKISTHWEHTLALKNDGTVWTWGPNEAGQLGNGTLTTSAVPVAVSPSAGLTAVVDIAAGTDYSLAVTKDGSVFGWGNNDGGELGVNTTTTPYSTVPIKVPGITP